MVTIKYSKEFFNIIDTLFCGQLFRAEATFNGYAVYSLDKCAYVYEDGDYTVIECNDCDEEYFKNYFDLKFDYKSVYDAALKEVKVLSDAAKKGKGIRILRQNSYEALISFIVSQNNFIGRIRKIINSICEALGKRQEFICSKGKIEYYSFPTAEALKEKDAAYFEGLGAGYRGEYIALTAKRLSEDFSLQELEKLSTNDLKNKLKTLKGVGTKVADCVTLFGFHRTDSFPVDTWMEKVYREEFNGTETNRDKITVYFLNRFKENSGIFQQYLFYDKRKRESKGSF